jgi:hypothetical protein
MAICLLFGVCATAFGQRLDGTLRGDAVDKDGAYITEAKVTATDPATGVATTTKTSTAGSFILPNLLVGSYTITIEKAGFAKYQVTNIEVRAGQTAEVHAHMVVGTESTVVEVTAGAALVRTETSQLDNNFSGEYVRSTVLGNAVGSPFDLAIYAPNTTTQQGGINGNGGAVGGNRPRNNNFTIDGSDDNNLSVTGQLTTVVRDAVAEFNLATNQFSAESGHSAGGQFALTTKSGSNSWHGSGFEYFNNRALNALDSTTKQGIIDDPTTGKPRYDFNVVGGSIGGPIIKNKFFVFGAAQKQFEGLQGTPAGSTQAPTAAGLAALNSIAFGSEVQNILAQFPTAATNDLGTLSVQKRDVNGNAVGAPVSVPTGTINPTSPAFINEYDWQTSGDLNLAKHQIRGRFYYNKLRQPDLAAPPLPQFTGSVAVDIRKASLGDVFTLSSRLINDMRVSFTQYRNGFVVPGNFGNFPNVNINDLDNFGVGPESNAPQGGVQNTYQWVEQQTYSRGKHTLKYGAELRRWIAPTTFLPRGRGEWQYASLEEFINDFAPTGVAIRGAGSGSFDGNQSAVYWFLQDDIKVNSRLTINAGMRYEFTTLPNSANKQIFNSISSFPGLNVPYTPSGYLFTKPGLDHNDWGPRIGFAVDPTGSGKWAVRGGFGIYYDVNFQNYYTNTLPPQFQSEQRPDITCALPGAPAWCANYDSTAYGNGEFTGQGFLQEGGLLQVNVPCATAADCRAKTQGLILPQVNPKIYSWSVSVQHEVNKNTSVELRYLGTAGRRLQVQVQSNTRSAFSNGAPALQTYFSQASVPTTFAAPPCSAAGTPAGCQPTSAYYSTFIGRPFAAEGFLGVMTIDPPLGKSLYNSGSVDVIHRMSHGLFFRTNYTYAHTLDNGTADFFSSTVNPRRAQDPLNYDAEYANSALDIRHKWTATGIYNLPKFGTGAMAKILGGWQISGGYIIQTGQPVTALSGVDSNGTSNDSAGDRVIVNPNAAAGPITGSGVGNVCWNGTTVVTTTAACAGGTANLVGYYALNPAATYIQAKQGAVADSGRNNLPTKGLSSLSLAVGKNTYITESKYIQFRAEAYNALNHSQYSFANVGVFGLNTQAFNGGLLAPYSNVLSSGFAVAGAPFMNNSGTGDGLNRHIQLVVKFIF